MAEDVETTTDYDYEGLLPVCDKMDLQMSGRVFLPILYGLVFTIGLVGNSLVVFTILKSWHQKSITDIFLLNLAISDLLFVVSLPFWASYIIHGWTLGNLSCQIVASFYSVGFFGGMLFISVISIDRYLAIVCATFVMKTRTANHAYPISVTIWVLAILFAAPHFAFIQKSENKCTSLYPVQLEEIWPLFSYMEINILGFLLPLCIMIFCYLRIIKTLYSCKTNRKKRAIRLILMVVIVFFLFWTPYHVSLLLQVLRIYGVFNTCSSLRLLDYMVHVTEPLAFSHCCLNPIIYAFAGEKFRKYLYQLVLRCLSFICFCVPRSQHCGRAPVPIPEAAFTSNQTQNTSDPDGSTLL
ncbi:CX3C chemokine receptor 1 [Varanus komodoensis]|uniref:CX3C chemokine receptor 1 n=1 Tax=Varanus komodoensis TaxID=61221 RepID=UPI001CF79D76|nr:CX3C chemokine receptor 1 [Varanus komodoensis]XP_044311495.1 CX3C chemokine receptor 1 [Varanus komodoensis]XP_044311502.1 CX3C chemokine receptor 1 [Varanus komodoensis]